MYGSRSADAGIWTRFTDPAHRLVCVAPGWTDTPFNDPVIAHRGGQERHKQLIGNEVPLGFQATPAHIASVIAFAVSDDAGYMTGQAITADGGMTC